MRQLDEGKGLNKAGCPIFVALNQQEGINKVGKMKLLIGSCLLFSVVLANAADQLPIQVLKENIVKIMTENPMEPFLSEAGLAFCKAFYGDFKAQKDIEFVEPIVATN